MGKAIQPAAQSGQFQLIPRDRIRPDPTQDRKYFDQLELNELAESITAHKDVGGITQPITVRPGVGIDDDFEIISGERRWRAAGIAGLELIPCMVHNVDDDTAHTMQASENIQKASLMPMELALSVYREVEAHGLDGAADRLGKSKSWCSQRATLLDLDEEIKALGSRGVIRDIHVLHLLERVKELDRRQFEDLIHDYNNLEAGDHVGRDALEKLVRSLKEDARTIEQANRQRSLLPPAPAGDDEEEAQAHRPEPRSAPVKGAAKESVQDVKKDSSRISDEAMAKRRETAFRLTKRVAAATGDDIAEVVDLNEKREGIDLYWLEIALTENQFDLFCAGLERGDAPRAKANGPADDEFYTFAEECFEDAFGTETEEEVPAGLMYAAYQAHCKKFKKDPAPPQILAWLLEQHGYGKRRDKKGSYWTGVALKAPAKKKGK